MHEVESTSTLLGRLHGATQEAHDLGRPYRRPLHARGVSAAFLDDLLGTDGASVVGRLTPGQFVHGCTTEAGDADAWKYWKEGADPLCVRSVTLRSRLSLVETLIDAAEAVGDTRLTHASDGSPYFGIATDFVSYTWHGTTCGELWHSLKTRAACEDGPGVDGVFYWIDVFAVAQNMGSHNDADLNFPAVIKAVRQVVAVASPWSHPAMLTRCWCLYELHTVYTMQKDLVVAVPPSESDKFKPRAIAANFDSILSTIVASVDIERAQAGREEDRARILQDIENTCGYQKLTVEVLMLMTVWLRSKCSPEYTAILKPPRQQVQDRLEIFKKQKQQARDKTGDDVVRCRKSDGVITIGGDGWIIIGGTDANAYLEPDDFLIGKRICFADQLQSRKNYVAAATAAGAIPVDLKSNRFDSQGVDILVAESHHLAELALAQPEAQGVELWTQQEFDEAMAGQAPARSKDAKQPNMPINAVRSPDTILIARKLLCFTGKLQMPRAEAIAAAEAAGAIVKSSVSADTDILVVGLGAGLKRKRAEARGVEVWTEDQFNAALEASRYSVGGTASKKKQANDAPAAKKAKKATAKPAVASKAKTAAASPPTSPAAAGGRARRVMACVPDREMYTVYGEYDTNLMYSDGQNANSNKFYKIQVLQSGRSVSVATNCGRLGEPGQCKLKPFPDERSAVKDFEKTFRSKTKNTRGAPFTRHEGKYQLVETKGDGDASDAALGRLSESHIHKGQAVLAQLRAALSKKKTNKVELGLLSNEFYSLIPTKAGRQRPPPLDNEVSITEKEGLLEFWLRMGFDDLGEETTGSPIEGVMDLPLPTSLATAASSIATKDAITSSITHGATLAQAKAGAPIRSMDAHLYGAILLYNSIYAEINRCLRRDWKNVRKYWNYLRLYLEAMGCLPKMCAKLWRAIAVDLFDEYEPGKVVTWWPISSCTASKPVAQAFINQLGGGAASLITLNIQTACDISKLSHYPHEAESLLLPGTKLRVLSRKRGANNVAEIEVEEVAE